MLKVAPKKTISMYTGVKKPQTGHIARMEQINTDTPAIDIIGIMAGKSASKSTLFLRMHGPIKLI